MPSKQPSLSTISVPAAILAEFLGVPEKRIEELSAQGVLTKEPNGTYHLKRNTDAFYKHKYGRRYEEEKTLMERAKRQQEEIKLVQLKAAMGLRERPAERQVKQRGKGKKTGGHRTTKVKPDAAAEAVR